ncbi:hypothetical protein PCASD_19844 [Puccinia coronata f. sp. avenae]|uniref:Uncharacterized protein n=1 Tax=Puccinia coronata f. sp. avenae TaxID=200324 RepID=A0A2N5SKW8_9BASI|nr:hypothetical protein PCASD_19844 [Puccinia coronata f. sp. avenae]
MAMQIGLFMKTEDLWTALKYMDRYNKADWRTLQVEMILLWGPPLLYTTQKLLSLKEEVIRKGGITNYQEFKEYLAEFSKILDYLVRTEQVGKKQEARCLFVRSFTLEIQKKIIRNLSINRKLLQQPDGTWKNPLWNDTTRAAETEIRLEEEQYYQSMLEKQLLDEEQSHFECHSQPIDQEDFPREPTMDNNNKSENNEAAEVNFTELEVKLTKQEEKIPELMEPPEKLVLTPEWRAQALEMIDTPMEMKHIVIEIPELDNMEMELDYVEMELHDVEMEKVIEPVPNQPVQQEESNQSSQSRPRNSTIQELKLTIAATEDPKFSITSPINWIQQIIKRKHKIFNKQLFKPHVDWIGFSFWKDLHQGYRRLFSKIQKPRTMRIRLISQPIPQLIKSYLTTASIRSKSQHTHNTKRTTMDVPQQLKNTDPSIQKLCDQGCLRFLKSRFLLHQNIGSPDFKRRKII